MNTIDKTIIGKTQPKQTNVCWIDTSGSQPIQKYFINGNWKSVSSSGLNDLSSAQYKITSHTENETIFEGYVEYGGKAEPLSQLDKNDLTVGDDYIVTINGNKYYITCTEDRGNRLFYDGDDISFVIRPNTDQEYVFACDTYGNYSLTIEHIIHTYDTQITGIPMVQQMTPDEVDQFGFEGVKVKYGSFIICNEYLNIYRLDAIDGNDIYYTSMGSGEGYEFHIPTCTGEYIYGEELEHNISGDIPFTPNPGEGNGGVVSEGGGK